MTKCDDTQHSSLFIDDNEQLDAVLDELADHFRHRRLPGNGRDLCGHQVAHAVLRGGRADQEHSTRGLIGPFAGGSTSGRTQGMRVPSCTQDQQVAVCRGVLTRAVSTSRSTMGAHMAQKDLYQPGHSCSRWYRNESTTALMLSSPPASFASRINSLHAACGAFLLTTLAIRSSVSMLQRPSQQRRR